jgi:hypothetical protein
MIKLILTKKGLLLKELLMIKGFALKIKELLISQGMIRFLEVMFKL